MSKRLDEAGDRGDRCRRVLRGRFLRSGGIRGMVLFLCSLATIGSSQLATACGGDEPNGLARVPDAGRPIRLDGERRQWHKLTLSLTGPHARERDAAPNPFTDYRLTVRWVHESGLPVYDVPGYFAADGNAAETSAEAGRSWRAHLSPDKPGKWTYRVSFVAGSLAAVDDSAATRPVAGCDGIQGEFLVEPTNKSGRDLRGQGRLQYVNGHYLRFAGSGEYFLKLGPDSPETLLAYREFDGTRATKPNVPLKGWQAHERDWRAGDPTWQRHRGKGLIGALNYLAEQGCNAFSFLPYNAGGDGDNVWPFVERDDKLHYDCSKLDQWQIVFDHAQQQGLFLHFKLQEQENDDSRKGHPGGGQRGEPDRVAAALDGGELGVERKLYCRELVARFAHCLALNWNLGEENTQSAEQQRAMAGYLRDIDPYDHPIVIHTFPDAQDRVYSQLLGDRSVLTGASLQNSWSAAHARTLHWIRESARSERPWVVANDEQNPASDGVPPDPGYQGHDGLARQNGRPYDLHDIRKQCLWGTLLAGGSGVEYYFGYKHPQNDLVCEDFRSREQSWRYGRIALGFFRDHNIPFWEMTCRDDLVTAPKDAGPTYCFAKTGRLYLVYLTTGRTATLDLSNAPGTFEVRWFDPRAGGDLQQGSLARVSGGGRVSLGSPPDRVKEDWLAVVSAAGTDEAATDRSRESKRESRKTKIVLAGDSTVTDQAGWGQGFARCLKEDVACQSSTCTRGRSPFTSPLGKRDANGSAPAAGTAGSTART